MGINIIRSGRGIGKSKCIADQEARKMTPEEELLKKIYGVKNLITNSCYGIEKQRQKVINANQNKMLSEKKLHKKICQWDRLEKQLSEYESEYAKMVNEK